MTTATTLRRRAGQRISAAVWGLLVIGSGALMAAALSGYEIDLQLGAIIVLASVGGWLLLSAAVSGIGRRKEIARATAPTEEEAVEPASASADDDPSAGPDASDETTDGQERDKD